MKKLFATTAIALVAMAGTASAQSVLERVLGEIDNATNLAQVNGTFANIAENIGTSGFVTVYANEAGNVLTEAEYDAISGTTAAEGYTAQVIEVDGLGGIDGSITNVIDGIEEATQEAVASATVSATEWNMPTFEFGDMATTALGAVNTGEITLGVNSAVDEAKTTSTQAVAAVMDQLGGSADTGAIVLNIASNMTGINGSISNTMTEVNGSIGNLSTTALGAVNTGTIVSGVNAAVAGIVGTSGASVE